MALLAAFFRTQKYYTSQDQLPSDSHPKATNIQRTVAYKRAFHIPYDTNSDYRRADEWSAIRLSLLHELHLPYRS